jgi:hypothetical protein
MIGEDFRYLKMPGSLKKCKVETPHRGKYIPLYSLAEQ